MLDGQGADEFLGGYLPFQFYNYSLLRKYKIPSLLNNLYHQKKIILLSKHYLETILATLLKNINLSHQTMRKNLDTGFQMNLEIMI